MMSFFLGKTNFYITITFMRRVGNYGNCMDHAHDKFETLQAIIPLAHLRTN